MDGLGKRIRNARVSKGLSLTDASRGVCTKAHLSAIELGKARPSGGLLVHLSRILDLPLGELVNEYADVMANPRSLLTLCEAIRASGDPEASLLLLERLTQQAKSTLSDPSVHLEFGRTYLDLRRFNDAQRAFANAVDVANHRNMWSLMAEALLHLGIVCCHLGEYKDAVESLARSVKATPRSSAGGKALLAKYCLATCFLRVGMHKRASDLYAEVCSDTVSVMYDSAPIQALAYLGLGLTHRNRQEYDEAIRANDMARRLLQASGSSTKHLASAFNNHAVYLLDLGHTDMVDSYLLQALECRRQQGSSYFERKVFLTLTEFARLHLHRRRVPVARRIAESALALARRHKDIFEQGRLHVLLAALSPEEAEQHKAAVFQLGKQLAMPEERIFFYSDTGRFLRNTEFEAVGREFLDEAIRESENLSTLGKT